MSPRETRNGPEGAETTPFSFKLMVAMGILYLGWRLVQGIAVLVRWLA